MPKSEKQRLKRKQRQQQGRQGEGGQRHYHTMMCQHTGVTFLEERDAPPSKSEVVTISPAASRRYPLLPSMETTSGRPLPVPRRPSPRKE